MPRPYSLGRRAEPKAETRARILVAAASIYQERGLAGASYLAVARAADVAPGTVRNHFPDAKSLATAVFDEVLSELQPPDPTIFDGVDGLPARIARLAEELWAFYDRSYTWWQVYEREPELMEAWSGGVERYYEAIDALMRTALGPLSGDDTALAVVSAVIGPPTFFALRARGLSAADAIQVGLDLTIPWLEARLGTAT